MEQVKFDLEELLRHEIKPIFRGSKPYKYNLINDDTEEKNIEGIQVQKKLIKEYLVNNGIPKKEEKRVHLVGDTLLGRKIFNTLHYEGFYIEGYKIKYNFSKVYCCYKWKDDYYIGNKYISSKLKDIYLLLKDKFDIVPKFTTITSYEYEWTTDEKGRRFKRKIESSKYIYNIIEYLEISKSKSPININIDIIDNIENNIEEFIKEFKEDVV